MESNDSPEIPDRGETSDIPGLPSRGVEAEETREETFHPELPQNYIFLLTTVQGLEQLDRQLANNAVRRRLVSEYNNFVTRTGI